jgi:hypothetical protein
MRTAGPCTRVATKPSWPLIMPYGKKKKGSELNTFNRRVRNSKAVVCATRAALVLRAATGNVRATAGRTVGCLVLLVYVVCFVLDVGFWCGSFLPGLNFSAAFSVGLRGLCCVYLRIAMLGGFAPALVNLELHFQVFLRF